MNLYLSDRSPLNSKFRTEAGQIIYKVDTPIRFTTRVSTITKVIPNDVIPLQDTGNEVDMRDRFALLALIEHKPRASSVIKLGDVETETLKYFRKEGWGPYGRHRAFTGPDGKEYKWLLEKYISKLIINDEVQTLVAQFHRKNLGIIGKAQPAWLEITDAGRSIIDTILVTFIYIEKMRKDKEMGSRPRSVGRKS
ncbi:hypothetical protein BDZ94DRAFT_1258742 [Collybia nuda]|uniref:DUF6593 domain-containing protein n=1 Tax=Collybia nuda TaxID=64659 RepID=A0A9P6CEW5_9AGAR|nr:hypothetical protein BDZ94DRAFT_1258742 [Collybia nuda]